MKTLKPKVGQPIPGGGEVYEKYVDLDRMIAAIRADAALIKEVFCSLKPEARVCNHTGRCAVGALAIRVGVSQKVLAAGGSRAFDKAMKRVDRAYGLTGSDRASIIHDNDDFTGTPKQRAAHVIKQMRKRFKARDIKPALAKWAKAQGRKAA